MNIGDVVIIKQKGSYYGQSAYILSLPDNTHDRYYVRTIEKDAWGDTNTLWYLKENLQLVEPVCDTSILDWIENRIGV